MRGKLCLEGAANGGITLLEGAWFGGIICLEGVANGGIIYPLGYAVRFLAMRYVMR